MFGLSPTPSSGFAAGRQDRRPKGRTNTVQKFSPTLRPFVLGHAPPGARLRRSLRAEDGDSERNRAIRSQPELGQRFNPSHSPNSSSKLGRRGGKTEIGFPA